MTIRKFRIFHCCAIPILVTCVSCSAVQAETSQPSISLDAGRISIPLVPLLENAHYTCEAPAKPARIDLSPEIDTTSYHLSAFLKSESSNRKVTIRRGGQLQQDQGKSTSTARFTQKFFDKREQRSLSNMAIQATLFFCDYEGLPEFIRGDFVVSGQVGNFSTNTQRTLYPSEQKAISLLYRSRNWTLGNPGKFVPLHSFETADQSDNIMGELTFRLELEDVVFDPDDGDGQLTANVKVTAAIVVTGTGAKP